MESNKTFEEIIAQTCQMKSDMEQIEIRLDKVTTDLFRVLHEDRDIENSIEKVRMIQNDFTTRLNQVKTKLKNFKSSFASVHS